MTRILMRNRRGGDTDTRRAERASEAAGTPGGSCQGLPGAGGAQSFNPGAFRGIVALPTPRFRTCASGLSWELSHLVDEKNQASGSLRNLLKVSQLVGRWQSRAQSSDPSSSTPSSFQKPWPSPWCSRGCSLDIDFKLHHVTMSREGAELQNFTSLADRSCMV